MAVLHYFALYISNFCYFRASFELEPGAVGQTTDFKEANKRLEWKLKKALISYHGFYEFSVSCYFEVNLTIISYHGFYEFTAVNDFFLIYLLCLTQENEF